MSKVYMCINKGCKGWARWEGALCLPCWKQSKNPHMYPPRLPQETLDRLREQGIV